MMDTVGEFFRHVRETKGLTLDAVASKTCIHPDFLRALEDNNFSKLPDQVFAKGFVRSYARSLGLDENDAMRRFVDSAGAFYEKQGEREKLRQKQVEDDRRRKTSRQVVAAATIVGLLALVLLLTREQSAVSPARRAPVSPPPVVGPIPPAVSTPSAPSPVQPENADSATENSSASDIPAAAPSAPAVDAHANTGGPSSPAVGLPALGPGPSSDSALQLDLEAFEMTWVLVRVDGGPAQEVLLKAGDRVRWKASDQFALTLGNAGGVRISLNGKEQGPFGPRGKVARDIVLKR